MQRIQSLDLARGFTVLIMPSVHVVMLYSRPEVQQSLLGDSLAFIAEGPGAQLFMLVMGIGVTFSSYVNKQSVFKRTFYFLFAAYILNFLKFIIPLLFGCMPQNLLQELQLHNDQMAIPFFILLGDILHFTAISYPILFLVYRLKYYPFWSLVFAIASMILSPLLWDMKIGFGLGDYFLQLVGGHPPYVFFPVFPWLAYPLIGLSLGYFMKEYDITFILKKAGWVGAIVMFVSCLFPATETQTEWLPFYRTKPADTLFHSGFVLTWVALVHWLSQKIRNNYFFLLLTFCSKNITSIYIIQWVVICWGMAYAGYLVQDFRSTFLFMGGITVLTLFLTQVLNYARAKKSV